MQNLMNAEFSNFFLCIFKGGLSYTGEMIEEWKRVEMWLLLEAFMPHEY